VDVAVCFGMEADWASGRGFDDCVPWCFADIGLAVGVDLSHGFDGVEGERVRGDTDDRALLRVSLGFICEKRIDMVRTIFLVIPQLVKMAASSRCPVDVRHVCNSGVKRAWKSCQRVQCEAIPEYASDDLETGQR
jgi:hypothetical protein